MIIHAKKGIELEYAMFGCAADFSKGQPLHLDYNTALKHVRLAQPEIWDPANPHTELGQRFQRRLQFSLKKLARGMRIYCALGSILDYWHGVDGFVEIVKEVDNPYFKYIARVTFDLTLNKVKRRKADFLLRKDDLENRFLETTDKIARLLRRRMQKQCSR